MVKKNDDSKAIRWEKRMTLLILTALVGYIAMIVGSMDTKISVVGKVVENLENMAKIQHSQIEKQNEIIRDLNGRVIILETLVTQSNKTK